MDPDIGHTLVHYLYTGTYQTLKPAQAASNSLNHCTEYGRGILAYHAARSYHIDGLAKLAIESIELHDKELSIFEILDTIKDNYTHIVYREDETWLPEYLKKKVREAYEVDETLFTDEPFLDHIANSAAFNNALLRIMLGVLTDKITAMAKSKGEIRQASSDILLTVKN